MKSTIKTILFCSALGACANDSDVEQIETSTTGEQVETVTQESEVDLVAETTARLNGEGFEMFRDAEINFADFDHAGTLEDPIPIDVNVLGAWIFDEDKEEVFPEFVKNLNGKKVFMKGFMLPDVDFEHITKFHLVRSLWGCCFGAPPRVNELIQVTTPDPDGMDYSYNTLEVVGTLEVIFEMEDGIIEDLYRLKADTIVVLDEFDDPEAPTGFDPAAAF